MSAHTSDDKPVPSSELRERVLLAAKKAPALTRAQFRARVGAIAVVGALATTSVFFAMGGFAQGTRPMELVCFTAGVGLFAAIVLTRLSANRGSSMLGRPRSWLVTACVVSAPILAIVAFVSAQIWPEHASEEVSGEIHIRCALATITQGALPLIALLVPKRGGDPVHPMVTGAALGMTAGAWTAMMAYLRCPHAAALHCIVAHVVPTLVLTALGAVLGRVLLRVR
jgi:hypothetical protein